MLAATKLHAPARRHDALSRPRLTNVLEESLAHARLTLISAPAGAGKTTLLAELPRVLPEIRWTWMLLDEEDNDPSRFAATLAAALEQVDARLSEGAMPDGDAHRLDRTARRPSRHPRQPCVSSWGRGTILPWRWRARGDLTEIRLEDLSFTEEESAELVNACLHLD